MIRELAPWSVFPRDLTAPVLNADLLAQLGPTSLFGIIIGPCSDVKRIDLVFPGLLVPVVQNLYTSKLEQPQPFRDPAMWGGAVDRFGRAMATAGHFSELGFDRFSTRGCVFSLFGGIAGAIHFDGPARREFAFSVSSALQAAFGCTVEVRAAPPTPAVPATQS